MTLARFTSLHPYRSSAGFLLMVVVVVIAVGLITRVFLMGNLVQLAVGDLILAIIGIFLLMRLDWWRRAGYTTGIRLAQAPLGILPCAIALVSLGNGIRVTGPIAILVFGLLTLIVGFAEETFFRGLILTTLQPTGYYVQSSSARSFLLHLTSSISSAVYGIQPSRSLTASLHSVSG